MAAVIPQSLPVSFVLPALDSIDIFDKITDISTPCVLCRQQNHSLADLELFIEEQKHEFPLYTERDIFSFVMS